MSKCSIVTNGKGGVGKTIVASAIAETQRGLSKGPLPRLLDCDSKHKLSAFYPGHTVKVSAGAMVDDILADPDAVISHWDAIGEHMLGSGDCVIDLGANLSMPVLDWASRSNVAPMVEHLDLLFVVPTTADMLSLEGAVESLEMAERVFPSARRIVVLNEYGGKFTSMSGEDNYIRMMAMPGTTFINMSKCTSKIWPYMDQEHVSFARAIENGADWFAKILDENGSKPFVANRAYGELATWAKATISQLVPLYK